MPASPERSTTWPSPVFAFDQRRSRSSSSSSRPTSSVTPLACRASKRLSTEAGRNAAQARTRPPMPLRSCAPRSSRSNRLPSSLPRALSDDDRVRLGNRLADVPRGSASRQRLPAPAAAPVPIRSPTTTNSGGDANTGLKWSIGFQPAHRLDQLQPRPYRSLGVVLVRLRIAEIHKDAVAHVFRHEPAEAPDSLGDAFLIGGNNLAEVLRVHTR